MIIGDAESEIEDYMALCKQMRESVENYSLYIHGFLIPEIQKQREGGKLSKGKLSSI